MPEHAPTPPTPNPQPPLLALPLDARSSGRFEAVEELAYHHRKFDELRRYTLRTLLALPILILLLWAWDWVIDPAAAPATLGLRIGMAACLLPGVVALRANLGLAPFTLLLYACMLGSEIFWLAILLRMDGGLVYGIGGYMLYVLGLLVTGLPLRFRDNAVGVPLVLLAPNAAAAAGLVPGFLYAEYNTLILPASGLALFTLWAFDRLYRRAYSYQRSVERLAAEDPLTGLANRRQFMVAGTRLLEAVRRYQRPACLLLADLDRFKAINDRYGHAAGDAVLQAAAGLLNEFRRAADVPARFGGEEFAVLLPETDARGAVALADRLRAALAARRLRIPGAPGVELTVTMSVGVAVCTPADDSLDAVLRRADAALYRAKDGGRNRVEPALAPAGP
jgi:diguanylate cyclase (GGDEF)-like protein